MSVLDNTIKANAMPVKLVADDYSILLSALMEAKNGTTKTISNAFARPADTTGYSANDVVSNSTAITSPLEFANAARVVGGSGYITGVRIATNKKSITPKFRLHLFNSNNISVGVDNAPWKELYADGSSRIGMYDLAAMTTGADTASSDMSRSLDFTLRIPFQCAPNSSSIFCVLETIDAFTPDSEQLFTVALNVEQN